MTDLKANTEAKGLVCPNCGYRHFYVVYTQAETIM